MHMVLVGIPILVSSMTTTVSRSIESIPQESHRVGALRFVRLSIAPCAMHSPQPTQSTAHSPHSPQPTRPSPPPARLLRIPTGPTRIIRLLIRLPAPRGLLLGVDVLGLFLQRPRVFSHGHECLWLIDPREPERHTGEMRMN
jgi:hypothetical protein